MKKNHIIAICLAISLSACSGKNESSQAEVDPAIQQELALEAEVATSQPEQPTVNLPANIQLPFAYNVVYDREYEVEGQKQKRILVEFTEGDTAQIDKQLADLLNQAGYRRAKPHDRDGGIRVNYKNANDKRIITLIRPADAVKMKNPEAKGSLYMAWFP